MGDAEETRDFWDRVAHDWQRQVGTTGDRNRILNSDPVLWALAGDVKGLRVLDAGCGTGYLTRQMRDRGADAVGVDHSERMIAIARGDFPDVDFYVDSCAGLRSQGDGAFDLVVSNYVLMDVADLEATIRAFHRVLRPGGRAIAVFAHPCFPQSGAAASADGQGLSYRWKFPYFSRTKCVDPPWGHFRADFIWFHRPLSDYWKAFTSAGFAVTGFEEPRLPEGRFHLAANARERHKASTRPYSVAFRLEKRI